MGAVKTVDARGLSCPMPVLQTQQALQDVSSGTIDVLVDSGTARDNVTRVAEKAGWRVGVTEDADGIYRLALTK